MALGALMGMGMGASVAVALRFVTIGFAINLIFIHVVSAQSSDRKSGAYWLRQCTSPEAYGQIECANYVRALVEYDELRGTSLGQKRFICVQKGVTIGQSRDVVVKYLRTTPQDLHLPFVLLAHRALEVAFPCAGDADRGGEKPSATQK
jgi:hypothetical protein